MSIPPGTVLAAGDLPAGEHWILRAGGTDDDLATSLETIYPDGHRDEGGMAGPALPAGQVINIYTGGAERLRRLIVRADPRVLRLRVELAGADPLELHPVATSSDPGLTFFVALLPPTASLVAVVALDSSGAALDRGDLARHEAAWQRFSRH